MEDIEHKKKKGQIGKNNGMLHVMWEQGWMYSSKFNDYITRGKKHEKKGHSGDFYASSNREMQIL